MRITWMTVIASAIALSFTSFAEAYTESPIVPGGHYCLTYRWGGTDCSFTSYSQCEASASGIGAECFGSAAQNDESPRQPVRHVRQ
jgi:hypothetical protein